MIQCSGVGRLVADPELKKLNLGDKETYVCSFTLAFNEYRKKGDETIRTAHFFDFKAWDTGGKTIAEKAKKGDEMYVWASPRQEKWEDKDTGQNRSKVTFRVNKFQIFNRVPKNTEQSDENSEFSEPKDDQAPF